MEWRKHELSIKLWSLEELLQEWRDLAGELDLLTPTWQNRMPDAGGCIGATHKQILVKGEKSDVILFTWSGSGFGISTPVFGFMKTTTRRTWLPVLIGTYGETEYISYFEPTVLTFGQGERELLESISATLDFGVRGSFETKGNILVEKFREVGPFYQLELPLESLPLMHFLLGCDLLERPEESNEHLRISEPIHVFEVFQNMGLLGIHKNWWQLLCYEFTKPYFKAICGFIVKERGDIHPRAIDTFAWTRYCRPEDVKVVVVGQDPYPNPQKGIATGLAFDLPDGGMRSPSLNTIFQALSLDSEKNNFRFDQPNHGCLIGWAKQGVLLLNAALTVRQGKTGSHMKEWKRFTNAVIHHISRMNSGVVFMLWGKKLWEKEEVVDYDNFLIRSAKGKDIFRHLVLKSCHPAQRGCECTEEGHVESCMPFKKGFHFSKANAFLEHHHGRGIGWNYLPAERQKEPSSSGNHFEAREVHYL